MIHYTRPAQRRSIIKMVKTKKFTIRGKIGPLEVNDNKFYTLYKMTEEKYPHKQIQKKEESKGGEEKDD